MRLPRRSKKSSQAQEINFENDLPLPRPPRIETSPLEAKTASQERYIRAIKGSIITFGIGAAGTGKSYIATALAADMLKAGKFERIIITRPAVSAQEDLGFLPGELEDKFAPYIYPVKEILEERLGKGQVEYLLRHKTIEGLPVAYMRGRTFKKCIVVVDEVENFNKDQFKLILTRVGEDCKIVFTGDTSQKDIRGESGVDDAINRISWIPQVSVVRFTSQDVVRSGICREIVQSYNQ